MPSVKKLPFAKSHAFIIGINEYQNGISKLLTAVQDAEAIAKVLEEDYAYEVHPPFLDAGKAEIEELLTHTIPELVKENDRVIFYFAGHGIALDSERGEPKGYLVPVDADKGKKDSLVEMALLHTALKNLSCKHGLLILDCCFAGAFKWSSGFRDLTFGRSDILYDERFWRFVKNPAWQVITSSSHDQKALDVLPNLEQSLGKRENIGGNHHSPFAMALLEALRSAKVGENTDNAADANRDGVITATEMYSYLRDKVEPLSMKNEKRQTPTLFNMARHDKGEFIFLDPDFDLNKLPKAPNRNPYKGLKSYGDEKDDYIFMYGRKLAVKEMLKKLETTPILVVSAPSAAGKSSAIRAGLLPAMVKEWSYESPIELTLRAGEEDQNKWEILRDLKAEDQKVVFIDQYEELFQEDPNGRKWKEKILSQLYQENQKRKNLKVILSIRSDFEWKLEDSISGKIFWNESLIYEFMYRLAPMTREELKEALVKPAALMTFEFEEDSFVEQILDEISYAPGALTILSFTMHRFYEELKLAGKLTEKKFSRDFFMEKLGGISGALRKYADKVYNDLNSSQQRVMRKLFMRMVNLNDGQYSRRKVYVGQIAKDETHGEVVLNELDYLDHQDGEVHEVLDILDDLLIVKDEDQFGLYYEPIHDALINSWPTCLKWIEEFGKENLVLQRDLWRGVMNHHKESTSVRGIEEITYTATRGLGDEIMATSTLWDNNLKMVNVLNTIILAKDAFLQGKPHPLENVLQQQGEKLNREEKDLLLRTLRKISPNTQEVDCDELVSHPVFQEIFPDILSMGYHWLNEKEAAFIVESWKRRNRRMTQLRKERDDALASALAAKAMLKLPQDATHAINIAYAALQKSTIEETASVFHDVFEPENIGYYHRNLPHLTKALGRFQNFVMVAFSPNGKHLMTASRDRKFKLWDMETGRELRQFVYKGKTVNAIAYSPDGHHFASGGEDGISFWDTERWEVIRQLKGHRGYVKAIAFSPDSSWLVSGSEDNTLIRWEVESGKQLQQYKGHKGRVHTAAFSPDGKYLLSGSDDTSVKLWEVEAGGEVSSMDGHTGAVYSVAFSPHQDKLLAVSGASDSLLKLWEPESGKMIRDFSGHKGRVKAVSFSPDGKYLISGSIDKTLKLWEVKSGREIRSYEGHSGYIFSASFSKDGTQLASSGERDKMVKIWPVSAKPVIKTFEGHSRRVRSIAYSSDGKKLLSGGDDNALILWDVAKRKEIWTTRSILAYNVPHKEIVTSVAFSPDQKFLLSGSRDKTLRLWNAESGDLLHVFEGHQDDVEKVAFSKDGKFILSGAKDKTLKLWELSTKSEIRCFEGHEGHIHSIAISPDGKYILSSAYNDVLKLWDTNNGKEIPPKLKAEKKVQTISFTPDGEQYLCGYHGGHISLWSMSKGTQIGRKKVHLGSINCIACSADGKLVLSGGSKGTLKLIHKESLTPIWSMKDPNGSILSVAFSPDGKQISWSQADGTSIQIMDNPLAAFPKGIYKLNEEERKQYRIEVAY